jgi:hypothetical protein
MIDNCFSVKQSRWETWSSFDQDGKVIITSLTEEECIKATRWYLKHKQESFAEDSYTKYNGTVGGKL